VREVVAQSISEYDAAKARALGVALSQPLCLQANQTLALAVPANFARLGLIRSVQSTLR
jgi:hypothetical protein